MREEWMRDLFEAEEGYELDSADQAQLEMRVAAVVAPEPGLLERFNQGIDPHLYTASSMTGTTIDSLKERLAAGDKKAKDQRQAAKPLNFGLLFGMQPDKLRIQAKKDYKVDFTIEQATEFRTKWIALHPVFEPWWRRCEVIFQQQGFVRTLLGSYRHWLPDSNKVCNTLVQSPATELVMRSLIDLDQYYETHPELGAQLVGFVHDSGITLHPTSKREEVANVTRQIMEHPPLHLLGVSDLGIPLEVEIKTGRTWQ
jgi:DNA polymerase I-like protein with 3'-5' exonuclease and polymerase domains